MYKRNAALLVDSFDDYQSFRKHVHGSFPFAKLRDANSTIEKASSPALTLPETFLEIR